MTFEVSFKSKARRDINKEASYQYRKRGPHAELRWVGEMDRVEWLLAADPHRYPQADEAEELGLDSRELSIGGRRGTAHRVLFTVVDNSVIVQRVRQAAQDRLTEDDL